MLAFRAVKSPEPEAAREAIALTVQAYLDLAHGVYQLGKVEEAAGLLARAAAAAQDLGENDPRRARVLNKLGVIQARQGKYSEAERQLKHGVAILERAYPAEDADHSTALANLGAVYRMMGQNGPARSAFERALKLAEPCQGEPDLPVAWTLDQFGDLEVSDGNIPAAVYALRRSLSIKERVLGPMDWDVAVTLDRLADLYYKQARYNEAEAELLRVVTIRERLLGWDDPAMAKPLARLAQLYTRQRKTGRAEQLVRYALRLFTEVLPPGHAEVIGCLNLLAEIYHGLSRFADAEAVTKLARGLVDGTEDAAKLQRFVFPKPPRISGPGAPLLQPGAAG
jgi:tetratricopeptide (TPR) repeat protein